MLHFKTFRNLNTEAPWITLVHGAGGSSTIWFKQLRELKQDYNLLLIDLRGHGLSKEMYTQWKKYTFQVISDDIIEVLDYLKIAHTHFIGISLGTIIIREIADRYPQRISSMILGGAVTHLNLRCRILMQLANLTKSIIPYMILYRFFAFIIMPRKNHRESRILFVREAKKVYQKEFKKWIAMFSQVKPIFRLFNTKDSQHSTLYIMGSEDYLFLPAVEKLVSQQANSALKVLENCGHVVNIEQPENFNKIVLVHLKNWNPNLA